MEKIQLNNGITVILNDNKNTPRAAVTFYLCLENYEKKAGTSVILNRLFLQGTEKRSAEEIAKETEENAKKREQELEEMDPTSYIPTDPVKQIVDNTVDILNDNKELSQPSGMESVPPPSSQ